MAVREKGSISVSIDRELIEHLRRISSASDVPVSRLCNRALTDFLKKFGDKQMLLSEDVARTYHRECGQKHINDPEELVADIDKWMASRGLSDSTLSRVAVALAVVQLRIDEEVEAQPPAMTPEQHAAFRDNIEQGIGDDQAMRYMDDLALAGRVQQMSMDEFRAARSSLGLTRDLASFLLGYQ